MCSQVRLRLLPSARCLFDEPLQVKVAGLRSHQVVQLKARATDEKGTDFSSWAVYRADQNGEVDLCTDPSLSGTYTGVHPMGLLWSLKPDKLHLRFIKTKSSSPHVVKFSVHDEERDMLLAEETNERCLMGNGVKRQTVKEGNVRGALFTPPGDGPFPAVLDLWTFMSEKRASLLANKGFVVLTVPVYTDKPDNIKQLHLDHFEEAVQFLQRQPKVGSKGVGIISFSKGGDLALSLAAFVKGIEAVIWINGCCANVAFPLFYKKRQILPALMPDLTKIMPTVSDTYILKRCVPDPRAEENMDTVVPIERATAQFLFVASEDDLNWDSKAYMEQMVERLKHHGKDNFETVCYPLAGHLLEPPYGPFIVSGIHYIGGLAMLWGGQPEAHAAAEVHLWRMIPDFLRTHLRCDSTEAKAKL